MPTFKTIFTNKNLFIFGLVLVIVGMNMSRFLTSLGQFVLLGNWIIEGGWKNKWQVIKASKVLWVMSSFYFLHLVGLFWTSDFDYALNDLRVKLPLLWLPLLFITSKQKLTRKEMDGLLWMFVSVVFISTIVSTLVWLGFTKHKVIDIRDISIFNSHIRFALMIDFVICFLLYDFFTTGKWYLYLIKIALIIWLISFLGIMQSFTGILVLGVVLFYQGMVFLKKLKKPALKLTVFSAISLIAVFVCYLVVKEVKEQTVPVKPLVRLQKTKSGQVYYNNYESKETENGNLIWANICKEELEKEWNKRSSIDFNANDKKGNPVSMTLIRYMSSLGLNKDSIGLSKLKPADFLWVEKGTTNYLYTNKSGIETRIHQTIYEYEAYKNGKNPTGHSFLMRLEFWRVGLEIIKRKWICGVGTGDVKIAYKNQYELSASKLSTEWRLRSHNQFMAITIAFGLIGLLVFLFYLFYPVVASKEKHHLFIPFFIIYLLSMMNEDSLETQAGVSFFGFFYCFLIFSESVKSKGTIQKL